GLETLVIIMVANKYAFLQITRRRFLNEWEAFKKVISRRNIRRRITIPLTLSNLKLLRRLFNWRRLRTRRPKLGSTLPVGSVRIKCTAWKCRRPLAVRYSGTQKY